MISRTTCPTSKAPCSGPSSTLRAAIAVAFGHA